MLQRHDILSRASVPEHGKAETSYPTPNKIDRVVIERVPIAPEKYAPLPYHWPHPDYDNNGLFLVWQGKVRAENNQVSVVRIYANDEASNEDWYNASEKFAGDVRTFPIFVRKYIVLREDYSPELQGSPLKDVIRLRVISEGTYAGTPTVTISPVGAGVAPTAAAIMNPGKTKVIALELLTPGSGLVANPTVSFTGGGETVAAQAVAEIQLAATVLVHEETTKLDSEDAHMASLFIAVHRVYETLPGPILVWDTYQDERGAVQRTSQSILASDVTGAGIGSEAGTFVRSGTYPTRTITKTWFEPRGDSAIVLTRFIETWKEVVKDDKFVTSEFGGAIGQRTERTDEPGSLQPEKGLLVISSKQQTDSPHEQKTITEKFDPSLNAAPYLELTGGGSGYATAPVVSFASGTCGVAPTAHSVLGFGVASVAMTNSGSLYTAPPLVHFRDGGGGGGMAVAKLGFAIDSVLVTNGGVYSVAPTVTAGGDGVGSILAAILGFGVYFAFITDPGGRAKGTLTSDNTNVVNNDTVTIGSKVYTFKTTLTPTEGEVLRGASADASLLNLIRAINHTGTPNVDYKCAAAHPTVFAAAAVVAHAVVMTALSPGVLGNAIATTETSIHLSWGAATLLGGFAYTEVPIAQITGDGTGAQGLVVMGSPVSAITMTNRGTSYETVPDVIVGFGNGSGLVATAVLAFPLASIAVGVAGSGYTFANAVIGPPETGGVQATATVTLGFTVASVIIGDGGLNYSSPPTVSFANGDGTSAAGTAVLGYAVASTTIDTAGDSYTTFPSFSLSGGGGTGATINIRMGVNAAAIVTAGSGYAVDQVLDISGGTSTTVGQLRITSVGGTGDITGVSIETAGVYSALASNPRGVTGGGTTTPYVLPFTADANLDGVLYTLGTNFGAVAWANPHTAGRCVITRSSDGDAALQGDKYCDRTTENTYTDNIANSWVAIDVGAANKVIVTTYTLQNRTSGANDRAIRNFKLQGTNGAASNSISDLAAASWTDIDSRVADTTMAQADSAFGTYTGFTTPSAFRWIRVLQNGANSGTDNYLTIAEIELYGTLNHVISGSGATFTVTYKLVQVNLLTPGSLYTSAPTIAIGTSVGTSATAHTTLASTGSVKSVTMTNNGSGYTDTFALIFTSGGGSGALATTVLGTSGTVKGFIITEPGSGYINTPGVTVTGDGTLGTGTATLATSGVVWRIDVVAGGVFELPAPTLLISGGGGSDATATATLDLTTLYVNRLHIVTSGEGYTSTPTPPSVSFTYLDGTPVPDLAATLTLLSTGSVKRVDVTSGGAGFTFTPPLTFGSGTASADAILGVLGKVAGVTVLVPGLYKTTPLVEFISQDGTGAAATATLASTGSVAELVLDTPGNCTVAPNVVFTGSNTTVATAIYHPGNAEWPLLPGFHTDEVTGIVINELYKVVPARTPYPPILRDAAGHRLTYRGPFIDMNKYDDWKSIQIVKSVDINSLPDPEGWRGTHPFNLPPTLLSIEALWSDSVGKFAEATKDTSNSKGAVSVSVSSGLSGGILVRARPGFRGYADSLHGRAYFYGQVPASYWDIIGKPVKIIGASGSAILTQRHSRAFASASGGLTDSFGSSQYNAFSNEGGRVGDEFQQQVHAVDVSNHLVGNFRVTGADKQSQFVQATATGGGKTRGVTAFGTHSTMVVDIPRSDPSPEWLYTPGRVILVEAEPTPWKLGVWVIDFIYVIVPPFSYA